MLVVSFEKILLTLFFSLKGFTIVAMHKPPVNSLSLEMIQTLSQSISELEKNKCKGFILTSVIYIYLHRYIDAILFLISNSV